MMSTKGMFNTAVNPFNVHKSMPVTISVVLIKALNGLFPT